MRLYRPLRRAAWLVGGLLTWTAPAPAQAPDAAGSLDIAVSLPRLPPPSPERQAALARRPAWEAFAREHPGWTAFFDEHTGTPRRAYGPALALPAFPRVAEANVEQAARHAVETYRAVLGADPPTLKWQGAAWVENGWGGGLFYATFRQVHAGLPVLGTRVTIRLTADGRVAAFGAMAYPPDALAALPRGPRVSAQDAVAAAAALPAEQRAALAEPAVDGPFVLPVRHPDGTTTYRLVWEVWLAARERATEDARPFAYLCYVDAHDGAVVVRQDQTHAAAHADWAGDEAPAPPTPAPRTPEPSIPAEAASVSGEVYLTGPDAPPAVVPLPHLHVEVANVTHVTDAEGTIPYASNGGRVAVGTALAGRWAAVDGAAAQGLQVPPAFVFSDPEHRTHRTAYLHVTRAHDHLAALDPAVRGLDFPVRVSPLAAGITCNAYWLQNRIAFAEASGGCVRLADLASVAYHEYGHGVNDAAFDHGDDGLANGSEGQFNRAMHEGMADAFAALLQDDPVIGAGYRGPGTFIRDIAGPRRYPDDYTGQEHSYGDGLILAGAFWDLRGRLGVEAARRLALRARYGAPDDGQNNAVALGEWYIETLLADDDDGDLGNGTPHIDAIEAAFAGRGITGLLGPFLFTHRENRPQDGPTLTFSLYSRVEPVSFSVRYRLEGEPGEHTLAVTDVGGGRYEAVMPDFPTGTRAQYQAHAAATLSGSSYAEAFPAESAWYTYQAHGWHSLEVDAAAVHWTRQAGARVPIALVARHDIEGTAHFSSAYGDALDVPLLPDGPNRFVAVLPPGINAPTLSMEISVRDPVSGYTDRFTSPDVLGWRITRWRVHSGTAPALLGPASEAHVHHFTLEGAREGFQVAYRAAGPDATEQLLPVTYLSGKRYAVTLPPRPEGSFARFRYLLAFGDTTVSFPDDGTSFPILSGYYTRVKDQAWSEWATTHTPGTQNGWVSSDRDVADRVAGMLVQPSRPQQSTSYYVTGIDGPLRGQSALTSRTYDLRQMADPVLLFDRWLYTTTAAPERVPWTVELSNDGGATWVTAETAWSPTEAWQPTAFRVRDYFARPGLVRVRFEVEASLPDPPFVEAAVGPLTVLDVTPAPNGLPLASAPVATDFRGLFPNPSATDAYLAFGLAEPRPVRFELYDVLGRRVWALADEGAGTGWYTQPLPVQDLGAGVYLYRLRLGDDAFAGRMTVVR